ncbi:ankyrin repeat-containing protein NPR4 [Trifolium repens]|nr:ankyrin repeat-containing protein NPR4 [Trifolium repens]
MENIAASGIVLEPLTNENYDTWSILVKNYLMGLGLWEVVANPGSKADAQSKEAAETWEMKNAKALHIILLTCGLDNLIDMKDINSAAEAWECISESKPVDEPDIIDLDIEQGVADNNLYKSLHTNIMNGRWNDAAEVLLHRDKAAMISKTSFGMSILHVAVLGGNEEIVKKLVYEGGNNLVEMVDNFGRTALSLVAVITGNINIAKCMVENERGEAIRQDLMTLKTNDGEIPVLLAAAEGHKELTNYLYARTELENLIDDENFHYPALLFTRCINAQIFGKWSHISN